MKEFDFAPLFKSGLPAPAAKWTGSAKYNFIGGNNDADELPLDGLIAASNAVLKREGRTLSTYGLASGPQGHRPLREFICPKAHARCAYGLRPRRYPRHVGLVAGD
jgi:2-aminoadipate transaminase